MKKINSDNENNCKLQAYNYGLETWVVTNLCKCTFQCNDAI